MAIRRQGWSSWVALFAAYLLVIQALSGAFATGAGAAPAQLDIFGNVICTSHGATTLPDGPADRNHLPDCCLVGCSMFSPVAVSPPDAVSIAAAPPRQTVAFVAWLDETPISDREGSPGNPRAPPLTA